MHTSLRHLQNTCERAQNSVSCLWNIRINIVKMTIPNREINMLGVIPIKILMTFLAEIEKQI